MVLPPVNTLKMLLQFLIAHNISEEKSVIILTSVPLCALFSCDWASLSISTLWQKQDELLCSLYLLSTEVPGVLFAFKFMAFIKV